MRMFILYFILGTFILPNARANELTNGNFEQGLAGWDTTGWRLEPNEVVFSTDRAHHHDGISSAKITHSKADDTALVQTVTVLPSTIYKISGWIKTDLVENAEGAVGATLCVDQTWVHSPDVNGTADWQYRELLVETTKDQKVLAVGCRLGYWNSTVTGTAWYDGLRIEKAVSSRGRVIQQLPNQAPGTASKQKIRNYWSVITLLISLIIILSLLIKRLERTG